MTDKKTTINTELEGSADVPCSPFLTPETDAAEFPIMTWPDRDNPHVVRSTLAKKLEIERNALASLACITGPRVSELDVRFSNSDRRYQQHEKYREMRSLAIKLEKRLLRMENARCAATAPDEARDSVKDQNRGS